MHFTKLKSPPSFYQAPPCPSKVLEKKIINREFTVNNIQRPEQNLRQKTNILSELLELRFSDVKSQVASQKSCYEIIRKRGLLMAGRSSP